MVSTSFGLKPFFSFYGGKWRSAPYYPGPHLPALIEPFAGSAGYACRFYYLKVHLYDVDPVIVGVWDYLIKASERDILNLPLTVDSIEDLSCCQEAKWLIGFWLNKGGARPCKTPSKWMRESIRPSQFWGDSIRERIVSQQASIRHWKVSLSSYDAIHLREATWFVDPPYQDKGRFYRYSYIDYEYLSRWCRSLPGDVIVCEQEGASWLPFETFRMVKSNEGRNGSSLSAEVVWRTTNLQVHDMQTEEELYGMAD